MKQLIVSWTRAKVVRWSLLAGVVVVSSLTLAGTGERHYQLGGSWIGGNGAGNVWSSQQIPLDPAGRTAALRVSQVASMDSFAGFLSQVLGADAVSDCVGEMAMISGDTARWTMVNYAQKSGNPVKVTAIMVYAGTLTYSGPNAATLKYTLSIYDAQDDKDGDGFPDAGAQPMFTLPDQMGTAKRVAAY